MKPQHKIDELLLNVSLNSMYVHNILIFNRFPQARIDNLSPCKEYQFRVIAENFYGRSDPCEPTSLIKTPDDGKKRRPGMEYGKNNI